MQKKLNKIAKDTNSFLKSFIKKQKKSELITAMQYGLFSGGKKIRSKILVDIGYLFKINYKSLIIIGSAIECIHAYSLIHDDLPCMDNDKIRRGKPSTHIKFGEASAVLAGSSLLTLAFEIIAEKKYLLNPKMKNEIITSLAKCSGHTGIAGGQELDLKFENKANKMIEDLESQKNLDTSIEKYQKLLKLNNIIEKKFKNSAKNINEKTKENILKIISKKNAKKVK